PSAKTILFRALCSLHRVQSPMSSRIFSSESPEIFSLASNSPDFGVGKITFGGAACCNAGAGGSTGFRGVRGTVSSKTEGFAAKESAALTVSAVSENSAHTEIESEVAVSTWLTGKFRSGDSALTARLR